MQGPFPAVQIAALFVKGPYLSSNLLKVRSTLSSAMNEMKWVLGWQRKEALKQGKRRVFIAKNF